MKKYILMPVLAALSLSGSVAQAQDFDNKPVVNVSNSKENLKSATPFPKCYLHKEKWTFDS